MTNKQTQQTRRFLHSGYLPRGVTSPNFTHNSPPASYKHRSHNFQRSHGRNVGRPVGTPSVRKGHKSLLGAAIMSAIVVYPVYCDGGTCVLEIVHDA